MNLETIDDTIEEIFTQIEYAAHDDSEKLINEEIINMVESVSLRNLLIEMIQNLHMKFKDFLRFYERERVRISHGENFPELNYYKELKQEYTFAIKDILSAYATL